MLTFCHCCGRSVWSGVLKSGWYHGAHPPLGYCPRAATWDGHVRASFVPNNEKNTDLTIVTKRQILLTQGWT